MSFWAELAGWCLALIGAVVAWRAASGTTLRAPWGWTMLAIAAIAMVDLAVGIAAFERSRGLRYWYLVDSFTWCPIMSLLGAKRPQDRGWQWIVGSLWVILALPVGHWSAFGRGEFRVPWSWWLLAITLWVVELSTYVATRYAASAVCWATAQAALFSVHVLPQAPLSMLAAVRAGAAWLFVGALVSLWIVKRQAADDRSWNRLWWDFRDAYGAAWGLRTLDRLNEAARVGGWPVRITWWRRGFQRLEGDSRPLPEMLMEQSLRSLLWRFVSDAWIDARLPRRQ